MRLNVYLIKKQRKCFNQTNGNTSASIRADESLKTINRKENNMLYYVIDSQFNQNNYPDLIGRLLSIAPSYAMVKVLPDPYRKFECWHCNKEWIIKVELMNNKTINLSGEKTKCCPNCNRKYSAASAWIESNGKTYPMPKPIKERSQS